MFTKRGNKPFIRRMLFAAFPVMAVLAASGCVSHLKTAKSFYLEGERLAAEYRAEPAAAAFRRSLQAAGKEAVFRPTSQAYMVKGMAEMKLGLWEEARESFSAAFVLGFEKGEEWARQLALFGLASSFQNLGLEKSAFRIHEYLLDRSRISEIRRLAAQKYADFLLRESRSLPEKERRKSLEGLLKKVDRLSEEDLACGYYHYVKSQVLSHLGRYRESLEEAVMARELGLPGLDILRDNDNQIVFCFCELRESLDAEAWPPVRDMVLSWTEKWGWPDPETPNWKKR